MLYPKFSILSHILVSDITFASSEYDQFHGYDVEIAYSLNNNDLPIQKFYYIFEAFVLIY